MKLVLDISDKMVKELLEYCFESLEAYGDICLDLESPRGLIKEIFSSNKNRLEKAMTEAINDSSIKMEIIDIIHCDDLLRSFLLKFAKQRNILVLDN
jgi:zona occludens toxin (predicted ATPase)